MVVTWYVLAVLLKACLQPHTDWVAQQMCKLIKDRATNGAKIVDMF